MTRKDYVLIAETIRKTIEKLDPNQEEEREFARAIVDSICLAFALENPRFDSRRFVIACGFELDAKTR